MQTQLPSQVFYEKTESGHREALCGKLAITRPVRTLLLVINGTQPLSYWLNNVRGVNPDDVLWLEQRGLVIDVSHAHAQRSSADADAERQVWMQGLGLIEQVNPLVLRETMKRAAWAMLKGLRAYSFVDELQSCQDAQEIRQAARCLLSQIWSEHGVQALRQVIGMFGGAPVTAPAATAAFAAAGATVAAAGGAVTRGAAEPTPRVSAEPLTPPLTSRPAPALRKTPAPGFRLARWPSPQLLQDPRHVRLATLLMVRTLSPAQLTAMSRCEPGVIRDFLDLLQGQPGLLKVYESGISSPITQEEQENKISPINLEVTTTESLRETNQKQNEGERQARHETLGFLGRLRNRLGLN